MFIKNFNLSISVICDCCPRVTSSCFLHRINCMQIIRPQLENISRLFNHLSNLRSLLKDLDNTRKTNSSTGHGYAACVLCNSVVRNDD